MHLHDGRIVRHRVVVDDADVLDVGPAEQDVVVALVLRRDRELRLAVLRAVRFHWEKRDRINSGLDIVFTRHITICI